MHIYIYIYIYIYMYMCNINKSATKGSRGFAHAASPLAPCVRAQASEERAARAAGAAEDGGRGRS